MCLWILFCIYFKLLENVRENVVIAHPAWPRNSVAVAKTESMTRDSNYCSCLAQSVFLEFILLLVFSFIFLVSELCRQAILSPQPALSCALD